MRGIGAGCRGIVSGKEPLSAPSRKYGPRLRKLPDGGLLRKIAREIASGDVWKNSTFHTTVPHFSTKSGLMECFYIV